MTSLVEVEAAEGAAEDGEVFEGVTFEQFRFVMGIVGDDFDAVQASASQPFDTKLITKPKGEDPLAEPSVAGIDQNAGTVRYQGLHAVPLRFDEAKTIR